jgi:hypothetical protein
MKTTQKWEEIEVVTGVARPGYKQCDRETIALDHPICLEQMWAAIDRIENSQLSPRLQKRYKFVIEMMYRLQMSLSGVLRLRGADIEKHAHKLKGLDLPVIGRFELVFHSPNKFHIPLVRARVLNDILPIVGEDLELFSSYAIAA